MEEVRVCDPGEDSGTSAPPAPPEPSVPQTAPALLSATTARPEEINRQPIDNSGVPGRAAMTKAGEQQPRSHLRQSSPIRESHPENFDINQLYVRRPVASAAPTSNVRPTAAATVAQQTIVPPTMPPFTPMQGQYPYQYPPYCPSTMYYPQQYVTPPPMPQYQPYYPTPGGLPPFWYNQMPQTVEAPPQLRRPAPMTQPVPAEQPQPPLTQQAVVPTPVQNVASLPRGPHVARNPVPEPEQPRAADAVGSARRNLEQAFEEAAPNPDPEQPNPPPVPSKQAEHQGTEHRVSKRKTGQKGPEHRVSQHRAEERGEHEGDADEGSVGSHSPPSERRFDKEVLEQMIRSAADKRVEQLAHEMRGTRPKSFSIHNGPLAPALYQTPLQGFKIPTLDPFRGNPDEQDPESYIFGFRERMQLMEATDQAMCRTFTTCLTGDA